MGKILDRYIGKTILISVFVVLLILVSLIYVFTLVGELSKITELYTFENALFFGINKLPKQTYEFFPMAVLVGSLLGLGALANQSELVVMRAAGMSVRRIIISAMYTGIVMMVLVFALGEFVVPKTEKAALEMKKGDLLKQYTKGIKGGLWVKNKENLIHIAKVMPDEKLRNITIYKKNGHELIDKKEISNAYYENNKWYLNNIKTTSYQSLPITETYSPKLVLDQLIDPSLFNVLIVPPEILPMLDLSVYVDYLIDNNLESGQYQMAFWQKVLSPFSVLIMLMLTIPFVFGSTRDSGAGQRILIGSVVGLAYLMLIDIIAHLGFVYGVPAPISVALPMVIAALIASFFIARVR